MTFVIMEYFMKSNIYCNRCRKVSALPYKLHQMSKRAFPVAPWNIGIADIGATGGIIQQVHIMDVIIDRWNH